MSKGAKEFMAKLNADKEFSTKFWAQKTDKDKEAFVKAAGYSFTEAEAKAAYRASQLSGDEMKPISHDKLQTVAGGCDSCANGWSW